MKKLVLYTALFGDPNRFKIPDITIPDIDRFFFTDLNIASGIGQQIPLKGDKFKKNDFYQVRKMKLDHLPAIMRQRFTKICIPDEIFNNYEYSVYIDCKRPKKADFEYLMSCLESGSDFLARRHLKRDCAYEESKFCIWKMKDDEITIRRQMAFYKKEKFPTHNGLYATFLLFRRHTEKMKWFSQFWWQQLEKYSVRDQISLPYVAWKHNMKVSICERA